MPAATYPDISRALHAARARPRQACCAGAQGFVSNRDSARGDERGDPVEAVMYAVFVATSERASVAELADMLQARPLLLGRKCRLLLPASAPARQELSDCPRRALCAAPGAAAGPGTHLRARQRASG